MSLHSYTVSSKTFFCLRILCPGNFENCEREKKIKRNFSILHLHFSNSNMSCVTFPDVYSFFLVSTICYTDCKAL